KSPHLPPGARKPRSGWGVAGGRSLIRSATGHLPICLRVLRGVISPPLLAQTGRPLDAPADPLEERLEALDPLLEFLCLARPADHPATRPLSARTPPPAGASLEPGKLGLVQPVDGRLPRALPWLADGLVELPQVAEVPGR